MSHAVTMAYFFRTPECMMQTYKDLILAILGGTSLDDWVMLEVAKAAEAGVVLDPGPTRKLFQETIMPNMHEFFFAYVRPAVEQHQFMVRGLENVGKKLREGVEDWNRYASLPEGMLDRIFEDKETDNG